MTQKTLKYRMLLKAFRMLPVKRIMAGTPEKTQKNEVFLAGADSIRRRLEEFGTHVTVEIGEGMYHSYAMMPLVEDAQEGYRHFVEYIKE